MPPGHALPCTTPALQRPGSRGCLMRLSPVAGSLSSLFEAKSKCYVLDGHCVSKWQRGKASLYQLIPPGITPLSVAVSPQVVPQCEWKPVTYEGR